MRSDRDERRDVVVGDAVTIGSNTDVVHTVGVIDSLRSMIATHCNLLALVHGSRVKAELSFATTTLRSPTCFACLAVEPIRVISLTVEV